MKQLYILAFFLCAVGVFACTSECPSTQLGSGKIFSSKPSTFISETYNGGRGNLCCVCAESCANTSGCEAQLCGDDQHTWTGFGGGTVNCQLFTSTTPAPNEVINSNPDAPPFWGEQCTP